ncbi:MAG TPA: glycine zipper family protein [Geobacter sp.]|nr:glycine zipper family protein [Geobacter sp.]
MKKGYRLTLLSLLALLVLGGCVSMPTGPSVRVLPAPGKAFEQFMAEDAVCRQWAEQQLGMSAQDTANQNTAQSAVVGTAIGAGVGAALGAASGNAGAGAAIGGGTGLLFGAASGSESGRVYGYEAQRRYDNTYVQCMYAKGNQVPGATRKVRRGRSYTPPPPSMYSVPPDYYPAR